MPKRRQLVSEERADRQRGLQARDKGNENTRLELPAGTPEIIGDVRLAYPANLARRAEDCISNR